MFHRFQTRFDNLPVGFIEGHIFLFQHPHRRNHTAEAVGGSQRLK